jgi:chaperonin GroES
MTVIDTVKPLGNRILVRRSKATKTKGGIILPDTAQEKPKEGTVIAAGPGKRNDNNELESMSLEVGNRVLFTSYAGTELTDFNSEDEELLIMSEDDVLGVLS